MAFRETGKGFRAGPTRKISLDIRPADRFRGVAFLCRARSSSCETASLGIYDGVAADHEPARLHGSFRCSTRAPDSVSSAAVCGGRQGPHAAAILPPPVSLNRSLALER